MSRFTKPLRRLFVLLGPLRALLVLGALGVLVLRPAPGTPAAYAGWALVPTLAAPVVAPLVFMTLLLDAMMSAIFMTDREDPERRRYRHLMGIDLAFALALALWWWPYYTALGK